MNIFKKKEVLLTFNLFLYQNNIDWFVRKIKTNWHQIKTNWRCSKKQNEV